MDYLLNIGKEFTNLEKQVIKSIYIYIIYIYIYINELGKGYFSHDSAYSESKDLGTKKNLR